MKATCAVLVFVVCAHAQEVRIEIPRDPFFVADTELAELDRLAAGPAQALFARTLERLRGDVAALNRMAQAYRRDALALQARIEALKPELTAFDEEKGRFEETCTSPANKQVEAMCNEWAGRLEKRREALQVRRRDLGNAANALGAELEAGLVLPRGALEQRIREARRQIEEFKRSKHRDTGRPFGHAADVKGGVLHMTVRGPERVSAGTVIGERDEIWTGPDGGLRIRMPGGSEIQVGPNTHVTLEEPPAEPQTLWARLKRGVVRVVGRAKADRCAVRGPTVIAARRGTDFIAEVTEEGAFTVTVLEGVVVCTPDGGGAPVEVASPQRLEVAPDGSFGPLTRIDPAAAELVWRAAWGADRSVQGTEAAPSFPGFLVVVVALLVVVLLAAALARRRA